MRASNLLFLTSRYSWHLYFASTVTLSPLPKWGCSSIGDFQTRSCPHFLYFQGVFQQKTKHHVQADGGLGDIQLQLPWRPTDWCLPWGCAWTDKNKQGQSLCAFKEHLMHVRRKSWAFPHSQLETTRRKRLHTRTWLDTWAFPSAWADTCKSQT